MHDVVALRARIRAPPGAGARMSQHLSDALRLAQPEARLLLVRRLALGAVPAARQGEVLARTEAALAGARARAVHGAAAAPWQDAVWFRSEDEARAVLLQLLARGEAPLGWFWRLAVPDWQGAPLAMWLPRWIAAARLDAEQEAGLARALAASANAGVLPALLPALEGAPAAPEPPPKRGAGRWRSATVPHVAAPDPAPTLALLPTAAGEGFRAALAAARPRGIAAGWIARSALLAAQPSLAAHPTRLAWMARALAASTPPAASPAAAEATPPKPAATPLRAAPPARESAATTAPPRGDDRADAVPRSATHVAREPVTPPSPLSAVATPSLDQPLRSRGAGVFLLGGPLVALGVGEWIAARDVAGFGPALLREIATRQRIPPEDPLFALLPPAADAPDPSALRAWRVGLDRWLRRRVRRRVAEIVRRPGTLTLAGDRLVVGFPLAAADLALRRCALDRDQGWLPWLGLALFFRFDEDSA